MSSSADSPTPSEVEALGAEVIAMRKEVASMAANSSTTVALIKQHLSPHTAQRARVSKMAVSSLAFGVPLGPGAETEPDFSSKWVALMGSTVAHRHMRSELATATLRYINQTGRVMPTCDPTDYAAVTAVLRVAASLGKGTHLPTATAAAAANSPPA